MTSTATHLPVLKREVLTALNIKSDGIYMDATLGRGGHAEAIRQQLGESGRLFVIDRDPEAIEAGQLLFAGDERITILKGEFSQMDELLLREEFDGKLDGILMDLGVSSPQLDEAERGFSFMRDGALDMRMNPDKGESAAKWLSYVDEKELATVLFKLGEEKFSRRIARAIVEAREEKPISTTLQLANIVAENVPKKEKHKHPATRTFQAIRIFINQELEQIAEALPKAMSLLAESGRLAVISFHSLEDRIVKRFIRENSTPKLPPKNVPVTEDHYLTPLKALSRAIKPTTEEVQENPRSRSSVLRVAERTVSEVAHA